MTPIDIEKYKTEWNKDVEARRSHHAMMNYHYLMYKGIQLLNYTYSRETLEQMGLHIHVPRTFTTIETIRSQTNRDIDIVCKWANVKSKAKAEATSHLLTGEWGRSHANNPKNSALADAMLFGSGYLLSIFAQDKEQVPVVTTKLSGENETTTEEQVVYEGMRIENLDPYYVVPDRRAKTWEHGRVNSPQHVWYYEIWDIDRWKDYAKKMDYSTEGLELGGYLQEFDYVRRYLDAIYLQNTYLNLRTRDNGTLVAGNIYELPKMDTTNMIMVLKCFEEDSYKIFTGGNWTVAHEGENPHPKKIIPIFALKDYEIPNELEGIGEAEVLRWQQYEENKIHNLSYLQILMNTVKRFAIVEELLKDPTEAKMGNPLKNIRLKYMPGVKISDAVQQLQGTNIEYPAQFLQEVKNIGQSATGISDYNIGSSKSQADTLGEAELMATAGNTRIMQKVEEIENRCIVPILEHWLVGIPYLYTDELEYRLNNGKGSIKFLPITRKMNENPHFVAKYSVEEGIHDPQITTVEAVFLNEGYTGVVFIDDLTERYEIEIKTSITGLLHKDLINQYNAAIAAAANDNVTKMKMGQAPSWDITALTADLLRQFPDIISDPETYKLNTNPTPMENEQQPGVPAAAPTQPVAAPEQPGQPVQQEPAAPVEAPAVPQPTNV